MAATKFEYKGLTATVRAVVEQKATEIRDRLGRTTQNIVEIGERLLTVKDNLEHGQFLGWLKVEFDWSESSAQRMMSVARFCTKTVKLTDLQNIDESALYLLAAKETPAKVKEQFVEQAKAGEKVTHKAVKAAIKVKAKPTTPTESPVPVFFDDPAKPEPAPAPEIKPPPAAKPAPAVEDMEGNPIHRMEVLDVFNRRAEIEQMMRGISAIKSAVLNGMDAKDELFRFVNGADFKARAENLYACLKFSLPHALCPAHADDPLARKDCRYCGGSGWLPVEKYKVAVGAHGKAVVRK